MHMYKQQFVAAASEPLPNTVDDQLDNAPHNTAPPTKYSISR